MSAQSRVIENMNRNEEKYPDVAAAFFDFHESQADCLKC